MQIAWKGTLIRAEEREGNPSMVVPLSHIHFDVNSLIQYLDNLVLNCPRLLLNYTIDEYYKAARLKRDDPWEYCYLS